MTKSCRKHICYKLKTWTCGFLFRKITLSLWADNTHTQKKCGGQFGGYSESVLPRYNVARCEISVIINLEIDLDVSRFDKYSSVGIGNVKCMLEKCRVLSYV